MFRISLLIKAILVLSLISFGLVSPTQSGMIDESPVVSIENRTDRLSGPSPFWYKYFTFGMIYFYFQEPGWNNPLSWGTGIVLFEIPDSIVDRGEKKIFNISWPGPSNLNPSDEATIYWSFYGSAINAGLIVAFPYGTSGVSNEPSSLPLLELGIARGLADPRPTPIFGFASPGILVGEATFMTQATPVPEPATMLLLGSGLIGLAGYGRNKFFKK